jgi:hypothetical protein
VYTFVPFLKLSIIPQNIHAMKNTKAKIGKKLEKSLIEIHKKVAKYYQEATKHHFETIALIEAGKHEKAWEHIVRAHGQHSLASAAQKEILKLHASYNNVLFRSHIKKYKAK